MTWKKECYEDNTLIFLAVKSLFAAKTCVYVNGSRVGSVGTGVEIVWSCGLAIGSGVEAITSNIFAIKSGVGVIENGVLITKSSVLIIWSDVLLIFGDFARRQHSG